MIKIGLRLFVASKTKIKNTVFLNTAPGGSSTSAAWDGNKSKNV